jgi:hypothetical protein
MLDIHCLPVVPVWEVQVNKDVIFKNLLKKLSKIANKLHGQGLKVNMTY